MRQMHWYVQENLARYMEKKQQGIDVDKMYPDITAHIQICSLCKETLELMMLKYPSITHPDEQHLPSFDQLHFLRQSDQPFSSIRPGSDKISFELHILLPRDYLSSMVNPPTVAGVRSEQKRGQGPIQQGGRLLYSDNYVISDFEITVFLTLHRAFSGNSYDIIGEFFSDQVLPDLVGQLQIGPQTFIAEVKNGQCKFENVSFSETDSLTFSLETIL